MARYDRPDEPYYFGEVIGSSRGYHRPTCHIVRLIEPRNYKRLHDWREAHELGLKPCPHCRPPQARSTPALAERTPPAQESAPQGSQITITATELADRRRQLLRVLDGLDPPADCQQKEGIATRIARLSRAAAIPREVAACMRTVTEARNVAEYEGKTLSPAQSAAVEASWAAVKEWAIDCGINLPGWTPE